jgi:4-alpha-glucanotransferase
MVRSACTAMDGLRIDHVMGLFRQFWIPEGGSPADGAYVRLRAHELVAIIRLESARAGTFVIGEDLGTVEPMVRDELRRSSILGTKVWWFDPRPGEWANPNLATVTTHDLPTVMGVWQGTDGSPAMAAELQAAVHRHRDATAASVELHRQVAASRAQLCLASLDDLAGSPDRPNHPGTLDHEHPNWCRRLDATTEAILHREPGSQITSMLADVRPHG